MTPTRYDIDLPSTPFGSNSETPRLLVKFDMALVSTAQMVHHLLPTGVATIGLKLSPPNPTRVIERNIIAMVRGDDQLYTV